MALSTLTDQYIIQRDKRMEKLNDVYFNRLFRKPDFLSYLLKYSNYLPSGLTIDTSSDKYILCIKHYGYFSSSNKGLSEYDDLSDYISGDAEINPEIVKGILEYFSDNNPEIFNELSTKGIIVD